MSDAVASGNEAIAGSDRPVGYSADDAGPCRPTVVEMGNRLERGTSHSVEDPSR
jgi:hypothetical protein